MAKQPKASNVAPVGGVVQQPKLGMVNSATNSGGGDAGLAPKPRANAKVSPVIKTTTDYDHQQNSAPPAVTHLGASGRDYADQQQG